MLGLISQALKILSKKLGRAFLSLLVGLKVFLAFVYLLFLRAHRWCSRPQD